MLSSDTSGTSKHIKSQSSFYWCSQVHRSSAVELLMQVDKPQHSPWVHQQERLLPSIANLAKSGHKKVLVIFKASDFWRPKKFSGFVTPFHGILGSPAVVSAESSQKFPACDDAISKRKWQKYRSIVEGVWNQSHDGIGHHGSSSKPRCVQTTGCHGETLKIGTSYSLNWYHPYEYTRCLLVLGKSYPTVFPLKSCLNYVPSQLMVPLRDQEYVVAWIIIAI